MPWRSGPSFVLLLWRPERQEGERGKGREEERKKEGEGRRGSLLSRCKQIVDVCMQGCVRDGEMKRVIILLLPWGLSQPRGLPIGPLTHAWAESRGPLIGPCDNTREEGSVCARVCVCVCVFAFQYHSAAESLYFLQVIIYWFVILLWRVFDL